MNSNVCTSPDPRAPSTAPTPSLIAAQQSPLAYLDVRTPPLVVNGETQANAPLMTLFLMYTPGTGDVTKEGDEAAVHRAQHMLRSLLGHGSDLPGTHRMVEQSGAVPRFNGPLSLNSLQQLLHFPEHSNGALDGSVQLAYIQDGTIVSTDINGALREYSRRTRFLVEQEFGPLSLSTETIGRSSEESAQRVTWVNAEIPQHPRGAAYQPSEGALALLSQCVYFDTFGQCSNADTLGGLSMMLPLARMVDTDSGPVVQAQSIAVASSEITSGLATTHYTANKAVHRTQASVRTNMAFDVTSPVCVVDDLVSAAASFNSAVVERLLPRVDALEVELSRRHSFSTARFETEVAPLQRGLREILSRDERTLTVLDDIIQSGRDYYGAIEKQAASVVERLNHLQSLAERNSARRPFFNLLASCVAAATDVVNASRTTGGSLPLGDWEAVQAASVRLKGALIKLEDHDRRLTQAPTWQGARQAFSAIERLIDKGTNFSPTQILQFAEQSELVRRQIATLEQLRDRVHTMVSTHQQTVGHTTSSQGTAWQKAGVVTALATSTLAIALEAGAGAGVASTLAFSALAVSLWGKRLLEYGKELVVLSKRAP